jgi:hydroxyethylthiazole kinase-like uncharacterized protein yjeF
MKPIVTVQEMRAIDRASPVPEVELVHRAAWAVSRIAIEMMGGTYGRRVVVIAGPGNNGADGRRAAGLLEERGVRTQVFGPGEVHVVPPCDLVIDAAFGTGFRGAYEAPDPAGAMVLAVDVPSGVNGDTGVACDGAAWADVTVTFAAFKPGHFLADGPDRCGEIVLRDIGLDTAGAQMHLFETSDLQWVLPVRARESHKWKSAVAVVAGSPGMMGAAHLVTMGAQRAGAGMVRVLSPGVRAEDAAAGEAVVMDGSNSQWSQEIGKIAQRLQALVIGPGLGRLDSARLQVQELISLDTVPAVVDADGIIAVSDESGKARVRKRTLATVLTPHDGEFKALTGAAPSTARVADAQNAASDLNSVVLLKGSTTLVAAPDGGVLFVTSGDSRLATAGTGDVLAGIVGAFIAQGADPHLAAGAAAHVHGLAARNAFSRGLIASDLPENVAELLSST